MSYLSHNLTFLFPKKLDKNCTHYLLMKINNKRELRNIATNHSADIDYKDFMKIYRKYVNESYFFDY